jgi:hypothetical protein
MEISLEHKLCDLYYSGKQPWEISRRFKISKDEIWNILRKHNVSIRPRGAGACPSFIPWNKGKTAESDDRLAKQGESISHTLLKKYPNGIPGSCFSRDYFKNPVNRQRHSERCTNNGGYRENSGRSKSSYAKNLCGDDIWCQSSFEYSFVTICTKFNVNVVRCSEVIEYLDSVSKSTRKYYPDFYISEIDTIVEIKGYISTNSIDKAVYASEKFKYSLLIDEYKNVSSRDELISLLLESQTSWIKYL